MTLADHMTAIRCLVMFLSHGRICHVQRTPENNDQIKVSNRAIRRLMMFFAKW